MATTEKERILVIRLGALGDLVMCFQAFQDIRQAHPGAEIALLVRAPFAAFAKTLPWFDRIIIDPHARLAQPGKWIGLLKEIRGVGPSKVYDLQGKFRQSILYSLLGGPLGPEWSGAAPLCKYPRPWPPKPGSHFVDFIADQLRVAGVPASPAPDLTWMDAPVDAFHLPERYIVFIPGCSPSAPYKRWPADKYAKLAALLAARNLSVIAVGGPADADAIGDITFAARDVIDLGGKTNFMQLAGVLRRAVGVVGNDTGPMHMAAALGVPTVAVLSGRTKAEWSHPRGACTAWRQYETLDGLGVGSVLSALDGLLKNAGGKHA